MLLVVSGDGLEPAANTILLHVLLSLLSVTGFHRGYG